MINELKNCIQDLSAGNDVLKNLKEEARKIEELKFLTAYHILKTKIIEIKENKNYEDFGLTIKLIGEGPRECILLAKAFVIDNYGNHWPNTKDKLKNDLLEELNTKFYNIGIDVNFDTDRVFGKIIDWSLDYNFKDPLPDLDSYILNSTNKALYQTVMLELTLGNEKISPLKKVKL